MWNSKIGESKACAIADPANPSLQLAEGTSVRGTARSDKSGFVGASGRLTGATPEAIRRLAIRLGQQAKKFHDQRVQQLASTSLQADERWGFAGSKREQLWQAEVIDPATRLVVAFATGVRNERLIEQILQDAAARVSYPQGVVLFTDGEPSYKQPEDRTLRVRPIFGHPYRPARKGSRGRFPNVRYRLSRRQAQVMVRKTRQRGRLVQVEAQVAHGSSKRVARELSRLGFSQANTSTIERRNGTARGMDATSVRKSLAFAKTMETKRVLGAWGVLVYNWARECRSLKRLLPQPKGRQLYERRSPAMAAGLTDHIWSVRELQGRMRWVRSPTYPSGGQR